jgi:N-acetyl-anhydromuramyl-L-alanine amidase AmpD
VDVGGVEPGAASGAHWLPFTVPQLSAIRAIAMACAAAWGRCGHLAHSDLEPSNREDPGPLFPMASLLRLSLPAERPE